MAPEIICNISYGNISSDIFSCGVILFALTTCAFPFKFAKSSDSRYKYIMAHYFPLFLKAHKNRVDPHSANYDCFEDKELMDLIKCMFESNPCKRITLAQIKAHPWLNGPVPTKEEYLAEMIRRQQLVQASKT
jgi:serine/threonine protein kinase